MTSRGGGGGGRSTHLNSDELSIFTKPSSSTPPLFFSITAPPPPPPPLPQSSLFLDLTNCIAFHPYVTPNSVHKFNLKMRRRINRIIYCKDLNMIFFHQGFTQMSEGFSRIDVRISLQQNNNNYFERVRGK